MGGIVPPFFSSGAVLINCFHSLPTKNFKLEDLAKMLIKLIEGFEKVWGAPKNWAPEMGACGGLPAKLTKTSAGPMWESAWEPTPEELKMLNEGGTIHLFVGAHPHPVVAMSVHSLVENLDG